jgi:hypothetical protein
MYRFSRPAIMMSIFVVLLHAKAATAQEKIDVAQIYIIGNVYTPAWMILRQLPVRTGDMISSADLHRAEQSLRRFPFWGNPKVIALPSPNDSDHWDILVSIQDHEANFWIFNVGYEFVAFRLTGDFARLNYIGLRLRDRLRDALTGH